MTERIIEDLQNERKKQEERYGEYSQHVSPFSSDNIIVIVTQLGEASDSLNYLNLLRNSGTDNEETESTLKSHYRKKLISVAACAIKVLEQLDSISPQTEEDF